MQSTDGGIKTHNFYVGGNLDTWHSDFTKHLISQIKNLIEKNGQSFISDSICLMRYRIKDNIDLKGLRAMGNINLSHADLRGDILLDNANINGSLIALAEYFVPEIQLQLSSQHFSFRNARIEGDVDLEGLRVREKDLVGRVVSIKGRICFVNEKTTLGLLRVRLI